MEASHIQSTSKQLNFGHATTPWIRLLRQPPTWIQALYTIELPVQAKLDRLSDGILLLRRLLRSSIFHLLWSYRHRTKHDNQPPPTPEALFRRSTATLRRYTEYDLQHARAEELQLAGQNATIKQYLFNSF